MVRSSSAKLAEAAHVEAAGLSIPDPLEETPGSRMSPGNYELRVAIRAQKERALGLSFSAIAAILSNRVHALDINYPAAVTLLGVGYLSTIVFAWLAYRSLRQSGRVNLVSLWVGCDVLIITAMVFFTGGLHSPWWVWYLACAGTAVLHRGKLYALAGAVLTTALYLGVLVYAGEIHGFDGGFFLAMSRLVFLGGASAALLLNALRMRESGATIRRLKDESEARTVELKSANRELKRLNGDLADMANLLRDLTLRDTLTGLRNRRYLQERIADEAAKRSRGPQEDRRREGAILGFGFLMIDIDAFKAINKEQGEAGGDLVLKHVAHLLQQSVRSEDLVIRWGGDEFVILLTAIEATRMTSVAEKVTQAVRTPYLRMPDGTLQIVTIGIGWAFIDQETRGQGVAGWEKALAAAEMALTAAKKSGRRSGIQGLERIGRKAGAA